MTIPPQTKVPARLDLIGKRILRSLADHLAVDEAAMARALGASEQVVHARIASLREAGLVQGFAVRVDARRLGESFEFMVTGAPSERTDRAALATLCADPQVTRAFGLASSQSIAFTVVGRDLAATRAHGLKLAAQAGVRGAQAVMVVATFEDRALGAPADLLAVGEGPVAPSQETPAVAAAAPVAAVRLAGATPVVPGGQMATDVAAEAVAA